MAARQGGGVTDHRAVDRRRRVLGKSARREKCGGREHPREVDLDVVRDRLDDDLDTPGALVAIDAAAATGQGVREAAELLGVNFE